MAASHAPVQARAACLIARDCCLAMTAVAALRPRPAKAFALLSHRLISGFFLLQGFPIGVSPAPHPRRMQTRAVTPQLANRVVHRVLFMAPALHHERRAPAPPRKQAPPDTRRALATKRSRPARVSRPSTMIVPVMQQLGSLNSVISPMPQCSKGRIDLASPGRYVVLAFPQRNIL